MAPESGTRLSDMLRWEASVWLNRTLLVIAARHVIGAAVLTTVICAIIVGVSQN
jgi:hypothetical protein